MYFCDLHTHSIASGHGTTDTVTDMAKTAYSKGLTLLGVSDHGPATMAAGTVSYFRSLSRSPKNRCGVEILHGVELNILDSEGHVDLPDEILESLDYAIISMHRPNLSSLGTEGNTEAYIKAMDHPKVRIIGHCDDVHFPVDFVRLVKAAAEKGMIMELNNSSLAPDGYRGDTLENDIRLLTCCAMYRVPVLLSSDSHGCAHIGDLQYADELVKKIQFPEELILNSDLKKLKSFLI